MYKSVYSAVGVGKAVHLCGVHISVYGPHPWGNDWLQQLDIEPEIQNKFNIM